MTVRTITAMSGLAAATAATASVALYFTDAGPPPVENVLIRSLTGLLTFAALLLFMAGLQELLRREGAASGFALSINQGAGLLFVGIGLVALSNEAGVAFGAAGASLDPTTDGPLAAANILAHGSVKRLLTALYLFSIGLALSRSRLMPPWIGRLAFAFGAVNLAFIPAMFFGTDVTRFYSAHGWGNAALTGSLIAWWVLAASLALLRSGSAALPEKR